MSQQINLINPSLIKKKDFLTTVNIGLVYGIFCTLMLAWFGYINNQVSVLAKKHDVVASDLTQLQDSLTQMNAAKVSHVPDQNLKIQIAKLEAIEEVQAQILNLIGQSKPQALSLANYMRGLAKQSMNGVWLTGFSIDQKTNAMTLRGRSLSANALPEYMKRLGKEPVFSGQLFGGLQIKLPTRTVVVNTEGANNNVGKVAAVPQYVEFELQGMEIESHELVANEAQAKVKS
jgi:Fimbrial assembly protein (PilN)